MQKAARGEKISLEKNVTKVKIWFIYKIKCRNMDFVLSKRAGHDEGEKEKKWSIKEKKTGRRINIGLKPTQDVQFRRKKIY